MTFFSPDNEVPTSVPITGVLNRNDEMAMVLAATDVFSAQVRFRIEIFRRVPTVRMGTHGFGRPEGGGWGSAPFLLGFEWSDGAVSTNLPQAHNNAGGLHPGAGGGGSTRLHAQMTVHLDHIPAAGPFAIITAWPFFGLPERKAQFDASPIVEVAATVIPLWDVVVDPNAGRGREVPPVTDEESLLLIPAGGWFVDHFDPSPPAHPAQPQSPEGPTFLAFSTGDGQYPQSWRFEETPD